MKTSQTVNVEQTPKCSSAHCEPRAVTLRFTLTTMWRSPAVLSTGKYLKRNEHSVEVYQHTTHCHFISCDEKRNWNNASVEQSLCPKYSHCCILLIRNDTTNIRRLVGPLIQVISVTPSNAARNVTDTAEGIRYLIPAVYLVYTREHISTLTSLWFDSFIWSCDGNKMISLLSSWIIMCQGGSQSKGFT